MKKRSLITAICLLMCLLFAAGCSQQETSVEAEQAETFSHQMLENLDVTVNGGAGHIVRTLHYSYLNNRYVSLRDMALALDGTDAQFDVSVDDEKVTITTGKPYTKAGGEGIPFSDKDPDTGKSYTYETGELEKNPMYLDGRELRYYSFIGKNSEGNEDCFMKLTDFAMQMDVEVDFTEDGININTGNPYYIDLEAYDSQSMYYDIHSAIVGDADTGEVYVDWDPDISVPIASTTKLMTYLVIKDAIAEGRISEEDIVVIPEEAAVLSRSDDGEIEMKKGTKVPLSELMDGMLLPSSNECALSLAIHTAGSEEAFVELMRNKAKELGMSDDVVFYNCHGLPVYTDDLSSTKVQNRMSAMDMFILVRHILSAYPEITDITSQKEADLDTLGRKVSNTNPLLYNVPGVVGLKTGTTNMAGDCLIALMEVEGKDGKIHRLVAIQLGAEDETERATITEEMIRYAKQRLEEES